MRKNEATVMVRDAIKGEIARAKTTRDFNRTRKYQQLLDELNSGKVTIVSSSDADPQINEAKDAPGD